jgi:hypothetical protein
MMIDTTDKNNIEVNMSGYEDDLVKDLAHLNIVKDERVKSPANDSLFVLDAMSSLIDKERAEIFHSNVYKFLYIFKIVRIEMLLAINF